MQLQEYPISDLIAHLASQGYRVSQKASKAKSAIPPGLAFERAMASAKAAATAELGPQWYLVEGASHYLTLPARLASYRFTRADGSTSVLIKNRRDQRGPVARFWPDGRIPDGAVITLDGPRDPLGQPGGERERRIAEAKRKARKKLAA